MLRVVIQSAFEMAIAATTLQAATREQAIAARNAALAAQNAAYLQLGQMRYIDAQDWSQAAYDLYDSCTDATKSLSYTRKLWMG